jgi:hypothetical protein
MEMAHRFQPAGGIVFGQAENRLHTAKATFMEPPGIKAGPGAGTQRRQAGTAGFGAQ